MLNRTRIVTRLLIGFTAVLLGAATLGLLGARGVIEQTELSARILDQPFTLTKSILEVRYEVLRVQNLITRFSHAGTAAMAEATRKSLLESQGNIDRHMKSLRQHYLGPTADMMHIEQTLARWISGQNDVIARMAANRRMEAIALNEGPNIELEAALLEQVDVVVAFAAQNATELKRKAAADGQHTIQLLSLVLLLVMASGLGLSLFITNSVRQSLRQAVNAMLHLIDGSAEKAHVASAIGAGDLEQTITAAKPLTVNLRELPSDELGSLIESAVRLSEVQCTLDHAFEQMTQSLRDGRKEDQAADWLKSGLNDLNSLMRGEQGTTELADRTLTFLVEYLRAGVGALYLFDERGDDLALTSTYAFKATPERGQRFRLGEALIGQAAAERRTICLTDVPPAYLPIASALGQATPAQVLAFPLLHDKRLVGAIELGTFREFSALELKFLELAGEGIAIGLSVNLSRQKMAELLEETQQQTEELRVQQEELQQSNEELEERAQLLEEQRESIRAKTREIEAGAENLRLKAAELERVSTYKSEFLANMSHELRTPLNSLMILSSLLKQNKDGNLTEKQIEFATTINSAGKDLLNLINDILDLSKVEAGQMQFHYTELPLQAVCESVRTMFQPMAEQKKLDFAVQLASDLPATYSCDEQRLQQILKNLLSNALKFTDKGSITLEIAHLAAGKNPLPGPALTFTVRDTGIGIPAEKRDLIFQAFRQADGSVSRKYGGTGLGLSISLQLARGMHGDIRMRSEEGKGSTFTLFLPLTADDNAVPPAPTMVTAAAAATATEPAPSLASLPEPLPDDRATLASGDKAILIIEDDLGFARILRDLIHERGFAVLAATDGETGIALAERYLPNAIVLDVMLSRLDGWGVMRRLKDNPRTRHIPVHFVTCLEDRQKALTMGAIGFATKPLSVEQIRDVFATIEGSLAKSMKQLLIVEDNADEARSMVALLEEGEIEITVAATGHDAIALLSARNFDCLVLDLGLSDMSGYDLLEHIQALDDARRIPVIIHSGRDLKHEDERRLRRYAESIIIKGAKSPERLLNEVTLFLHLVESKLHPSKQRMIRTALDKEAMLEGRKVLIVDDDMRNLFSLSSVLAEKNMVVIEAENGQEALARLEEHPDIGIVLMDIMMPEMDGYTAMREMRSRPAYAHLPVIAMTAKALKGDHDKCLDAGASDYIAKPIDVDKLFSLIRVWLFQHG